MTFQKKFAQLQREVAARDEKTLRSFFNPEEEIMEEIMERRRAIFSDPVKMEEELKRLRNRESQIEIMIQKGERKIMAIEASNLLKRKLLKFRRRNLTRQLLDLKLELKDLQAGIGLLSPPKPPTEKHPWRKFLPAEVEARLRANDLETLEELEQSDPIPVCKLILPGTDCTWLLGSMDPQGVAFGLWDLGIGSPKLESFSLGGLASQKSTLGHGVEMDLNFQPTDKPLSHYAREAMAAGRITV